MTENKIKPSTIAGFMELLPEDQILFNDMMDTIKKNYELHGFVPINTPNNIWFAENQSLANPEYINIPSLLILYL